MTYRSSAQTSLFIKTQEGDTVRLKIQTSEAVKLSASQLEDGDNLVRQMQLQGTSGTQIKFFVNGDLNADELTAITKVIDQAGLLAEDFFANGVDSAFQAASALDIDGQQLAKVGLKLSAREQFTYTQRSVLAAAPTATAASNLAPTASMPPPMTVAAAPSATQTQPAAPPALSVAAGAAPTPPTISSAAIAAAVAADMAVADDADLAATPPDTATAAEPTPAGNQTGFMASVFGAISDFLNRMIETFDDVQVANDQAVQEALDTPSISMELKLRIFESVLFSVSATTIVPAAETQSSATSEAIDTDDAGALPALVAETIDAVAANQQPPLHAIA